MVPVVANGAARKVNVLFLTTGLGIGGAEIVVRDLARALDRTRFNVSICCIKALGPIGRELQAEGIDISVLEADPEKTDYFSALKLRRLARQKQVDVIHSHTTHSLSVAALCRCVTPGVKVVHTFHFGNYPHKPAKTLLMEYLFSRLVDRLVAVGEVQRGQIKSTYRLSDSAIGTVRNGVQLPVPGAGDPTFRTRIGAEGKVLVGTIATLIPQKGLADLLEVARRVRDVRDDVHFVLIGEGDLRGDLERIRRERGLEETVTLTGWVANAASVALPSFDVYFQPSLWEAMSISILEAMAAGKPVVSTLVGEAPHLIEHGVDGLLFPPGDVESMAAAILDLAGDDVRRRTIGGSAARKVAERFTVAHMARAHEQLYTELAASPPALVTDVAR